MKRLLIPFIALTAALAGCTTTGSGRGTDAIRYHLGQPIVPGTIAIETMPGGTPMLDGEAGVYADAVRGELSRLGFTPAQGAAASSQYVVAVGVARASRGQVRTPPKFSIGLGGGGFGRNVGVGGGVSTGFGSKTRDIVSTELRVQLRRRSDGTTVWEGRAERSTLMGGRDSEPVAQTAARLAGALFKGFPGESGVTITAP